MKNIPSPITFLLLLLAAYLAYTTSMPTYDPEEEVSTTEFSTQKALHHVKKISKSPHGVGFPEHSKVRDYIVSELQKLGLEATLQVGYTAGDWANFSKVVNVLARIEGSEDGKALLVLSHYDSSPHSSLGASDAGSGVATILEGVRAFMSENQKPKNDIIILISDAEELGLNGADLFVNDHPWAKDVGLVLNFEARGSGGPSYTFMETNRGNQNLVKGFIAANPAYPMANSLYYSIYKLLPNDTDLTVFREHRDIEGFNFAFIDDHFDYHTAQDSYERLDKNTLAHQGSYLMPLLHYFANADLGDLKSLNDFVYFNMPFIGMVSYPFDYIWPMLVIAVIAFVLLLIKGIRRKTLGFKDILMGFVPMLITIVVNGLIGYYAWPVLKWAYPSYGDMLHGFTYNGYTYILAFVTLSIAIGFLSYHRFKKITPPNLLVAPLVIWLILCGGAAIFLPGASFFIVPVFALLAALLVTVNQKEPSALLLIVLALPGLWLYTPFIQGFTVGLGLKMLVASTVLTSLLFFLLLPVFGFYRNKRIWGHIFLITFFVTIIIAHFHSGFDRENGKPSSLLYILNLDEKKAHWATYDHVLIDWNQEYFKEPQKASDPDEYFALGSKYQTHFTKLAPAPVKEIAEMNIEKTQDTLIGNNRSITVCITPQRPINRLDIFTNTTEITEAFVNGIPLSSFYLQNRKGPRLLTHFVSDNNYTELQLTFPKNTYLELTFYEASNNLIGEAPLNLPKRPENSIPMPFVLNDAVLTTKTVRFD
ncbi:M28 family peptidase [Pareuzebyella sediminis]|uniref:M28 family peptidase n=1 Tax=Pareuzebyella sediminis TaxID=2607998 RepID=UPI0011EE0250|nr:M28 family peptidase [Pareuzebyella sediminis]